MTLPHPERPRERNADIHLDPELDLHDLEGEGFDLEERNALRRVSGIRTDLEDVTEVEYRALRLERVVLMGVYPRGDNADTSLFELKALAETAGCEVLEGLIQRKDMPDPKSYVGSGKAQELRDAVLSSGADTVICDGELSPGQLRALEDLVKVKVIDRTWLILDIFATHATSREGKAQVELAQMTYMLPRLRGWGESLSRQGGGAGGGAGGVGTRGPGETKIETDRRRIRARQAKLAREIKEMKTAREVKRQERRRHEVPSVAIAGYTNAGKSSLLNRLTGAGVLVENALFATLDPTVRRAETPSGREFTLTDTVGFVRRLPHQLVEAFRSTLEEVGESDLILHVVDGSDQDPEGQLQAVRQVFAEIGAHNVPEVVVINKSDAADPLVLSRIQRREKHSVAVSAKTGAGLDQLVQILEDEVPRPETLVRVVLPYAAGRLVARIHDEGEILAEEHLEEGTRLEARVGPQLAAELADYLVA
ncbi:MAG: GTPase HflX [Frankiales bacterium]|nr:GTPase HflX [Frankiales bacterium]MCW2706354.1 GTPase HflX [Frankiales bacterium]